MTQYELSYLDILCLVKGFVYIYFIIVYVESKLLKAIVFVCINQNFSKKTRDMNFATASLLECGAYY